MCVCVLHRSTAGCRNCFQHLSAAAALIGSQFKELFALQLGGCREAEMHTRARACRSVHPGFFFLPPPPPSSRKNKIVSAEIKINSRGFFSGWESSCLTRCQKLHSTLFSLVLPDSGFFFNQIWAQSSVSQSGLQTHMKEESSQPPMQSFSRRAEKCNFEFQIWLACGSSDWSDSSSRNSSRFLQETSGISKVSPRNHTEGSPRNHSLISEGAQGLSLDPP